MNIRKVRLTKKNRLDVTYYDKDGNDVTVKGKHTCHEDFINALQRLVPYFAEVTEQKEADRIDWSDPEGGTTKELLKNIAFSGLTTTDAEDSVIVVMNGLRRLQTREVIKINSPGIDMAFDPDWPRHAEFMLALGDVFAEARLYVENRKWDSVVLDSEDVEVNEDPFAEVTPTAEIEPLEDIS